MLGRLRCPAQDHRRLWALSSRLWSLRRPACGKVGTGVKGLNQCPLSCQAALWLVALAAGHHQSCHRRRIRQRQLELMQRCAQRAQPSQPQLALVAEVSAATGSSLERQPLPYGHSTHARCHGFHCVQLQLMVCQPKRPASNPMEGVIWWSRTFLHHLASLRQNSGTRRVTSGVLRDRRQQQFHQQNSEGAQPAAPATPTVSVVCCAVCVSC